MKILKTLWHRAKDGRWAIDAFCPLDLKGKITVDDTLFQVADDVVSTQASPVVGVPFLGIGTTQSFLGQSVVPIVANVHGENSLRCVGTGFFVSCTGLLITAAHVITDPIERDYGDAIEQDDITWIMRKLNFGVLVPTHPMFQQRGFAFYPFEWGMFLAEKRPHPIPFHGMDLKLNSDIAICKVPARPDGRAHQPLTVVQAGIRGTSLVVGGSVGAIGYPGMVDVDLMQTKHGGIVGEGHFVLHASTGQITEWLPDNLATKTVSTPGPCFSFDAKIPGGMSGGPIFDREGIYVHGVVSKGLDGAFGPENLSFGSMLAGSMGLPIARMNGASLLKLQSDGNEGMPILRGPGL
jgi:hypothetical protein